jgi:hypothetical protein
MVIGAFAFAVIASTLTHNAGVAILGLVVGVFVGMWVGIYVALRLMAR